MSRIFRIVFAVVVVAGFFGAGFLAGQNRYGKPGTVVHVVSGQWKEGTPQAEKDKAITGVEEMARQIPGIKNVWLKPVRVQPREYNYVFVMEFTDAKAAEAYATHPAHEKWSEHYLSIREESRSLQATN